jgi:tRNA A37 methylthiotransferase MiaB
VAEASAVYPVIKLAAQDVAAYGRDCSVTLGSLLRALFKEFPSIKVKLGPLNPEWLMKSSDGDLGLLGRNNMVGNIHIPLQSASDAILRPMNKRYPYRAFAALWEKLLRLGVTSLSTDLMAGFPGERQRDHEMNLEFLETHRLEFAQIFMYQPRPGTQAATYKQLPYRIRLERTVDLIAKYIGAYMRFHGIALNQLLCGKQIIPPFNSNVDFRRE